MNHEKNQIGTFKKRFAFKVLTNFIGLLIGVAFASLVPRSLGPKVYGDYNFLVNFFSQLISFLDMRSSTFFYTKLSASSEDTRFAVFYLYLTLIISSVVIIFSLVCLSLPIHQMIWPGQAPIFILFAAVLAILFWYADLLGKACDALGLTVSLEKIKMINQILFFLLLLALIGWAKFGIYPYLWYQMARNGVIITSLIILILVSGKFIGHTLSLHRVGFRENMLQVFQYSSPIFVYSSIEIVSNYFDRWMLQYFWGSVEQGLFSLSMNITLVFNVFINALQPLLMREFSIAFAAQDLKRVASTFQKVIPSVFALTAVICCFIATNAGHFIQIFGGASFSGARHVFSILALLPIIHCYSILSGSVLWASGQTKLIRNLGIAMAPVGLLMTYFLVAPNRLGGAGEGALGLSLKIVCAEFIGVNLVLFFNSKMLRLNFKRLLFHQVSTIAFFLGAAWGARLAISPLQLAGELHIFLEIFLSGCIYLATVIPVLWFFPFFLGISRHEMISLLTKARNSALGFVGVKA